jgi:WD40 repeat protein
MNTRFELAQIMHEDTQVLGLEFRDENTLVKAVGGGTVSICDLQEKRQRGILKDAFAPILLSPDRKLLVTASGSSDPSIKVFASDTGQLLYGKVIESSGAWPLAFSPDGETLAVGHQRGVTLCVARSLNVIQSFKTQFPARSAAFLSHDRLATAANRVEVWNTTTAKQDFAFAGLFPVLAFSPQADTVATVDDFGALSLWNPASGQLRREPRKYSSMSDFWETFFVMAVIGPIGGLLTALWKAAPVVRYSPDGTILATFHGGKNKRIRIRQGSSGDPLQWLKGHRAPVTSLAFSPSGLMLASGSLDQTVRIWQPANKSLQPTAAALGS